MCRIIRLIDLCGRHLIVGVRQHVDVEVPADRVECRQVGRRHHIVHAVARIGIHHPDEAGAAADHLPVRRLPAIAEIFAGRKIGVAAERRRAAIDREIGGYVELPVELARCRIAEQVQPIGDGGIVDVPGRARRSVEGVDAAGEAQRVPDLVNGGADEIIATRADPVGGIKVEWLGAGEDDLRIQTAQIVHHRLQIGAGQRDRAADGAAIGGNPAARRGDPVVMGRIVIGRDQHRGRARTAQRLEVADGLRIERAVAGDRQRILVAGNGDAVEIAEARAPQIIGVERLEADIDVDRGVVGEHRFPIAGRDPERPVGRRSRHAANVVQHDMGLRPDRRRKRQQRRRAARE
jgi:hypothetical protein